MIACSITYCKGVCRGYNNNNNNNNKSKSLIPNSWPVWAWYLKMNDVKHHTHIVINRNIDQTRVISDGAGMICR